ncbi:hypothetical protein [Kitasatospora viridis]|uniref:NHL repeat-containing protein n=1 Tax=Kitasatospora viridis TaxID=281105 RepID=A0A561S941_9ACTN|nr:hypothetical protein [Kitasatospora viridis]TWF71391.1 hypothetical protein FHX73_1921 [Kitasatospora viridis]
MRVHTRLAALAALITAAGAAGLAAPSAATAQDPFIGPFGQVTTIASTVPGNGDQNPYGTVLIKHDEGDLRKGDVLVSNFNNAANLQGTGTTLVQVAPDGTASQFAQIDPNNLPGPCPGGVGLTTALTVLPGGWVVVGSLPTTDGSSATASAGCLLVLDKHGRVRETLAGDGINGPWDMTSASHGDHTDLYVTNVLNNTQAGGGNEVDEGTVLRISLRDGVGDEPPRRESTTVIGSGFGEKTDPSALVIGPTGVALNHDGTLYVADTVGNRITEIRHADTRPDSAGTGRVVTSGGDLNGPLGLARTPCGDLLTVNSLDGFIVETTPHGEQVAKFQLDSSGTGVPGAGALFGLAVDDNSGVYFVDDAGNQLDLFH